MLVLLIKVCSNFLINISAKEGVNDLIEKPSKWALMLSDTATYPGPRRILVIRPEGDRGVVPGVVRVECLHIVSPFRSQIEVVSLPLMLEEETLITEQTRDGVRSRPNVCNMLDKGRPA